MVVLAAVCVVWLLLFLVFLPFVLVAMLIGDRGRAAGELEPLPQTHSKPADDTSQPLIFDRRSDVSKLFGCNTRNVRYRWQVFSTRLEQILKEHDQPNALDFGA